MNWRDIESAPRDGSDIVVVLPFGEETRRAAVVHWHRDRWMNSTEGRWYGESLPTHWAPLPGTQLDKEPHE